MDMRSTLMRLLVRPGGGSAAGTLTWSDVATYRSWVAGEADRGRFAAIGCNRDRAFFPHRVRRIPKAGVDAFYVAWRMTGIRDPERLWSVTLHADGPALDELPPDLAADDDLMWHRGGQGLPGHVGCADVAIAGDTLWCVTLHSDLVQRISRRPELATRVRQIFGGWANLLVNAVLLLARDRGVTRVRSASSDLVLRYVDPMRRPGRELFQRVYDRTVERNWAVRREGDWWTLDLAANADRIVPLAPAEDPAGPGRAVCVFHDIERGIGPAGTDPGFAARADRDGAQHLERILRIEADAGVRTTHAVVGLLLPAVRDRIEAAGHELAFHSADHGSGAQLRRCREIDYRARGYRPPGSRITMELRARSLVRWNFDWLAASAHALGRSEPVLADRIVRIPIALDDYPLHRGTLTFEAWQRALLEGAARREVTVVALHDCYAPHWIDRYPALLEALASHGRTLRAGDIADRLFLGAAV
jgi:peptidoglycan/xylan/chitin deacetylase (PgdA/CDA1 family)